MGRRHRGGQGRNSKKSFKRSARPKKPKDSSAQLAQLDSQLSEVDAGIDGYIGDHDGLSGLIKSRFSDFHVNEISMDGNIVKLTTTSAPPAPRGEACEKPVVDTSALPEDIWARLDNLKNGRETRVTIDVTDKTKNQRKRINQVIRQKYDGALNCNTEDYGDRKFIAVVRSQGGPRRDFAGGGGFFQKSAWPEERGPYVHFVLYKENLDTVIAVNLIAAKLRIKASLIKYSGMQDKRAITSQLMSAFKVEPSRLQYVGNGLRKVVMGNYSFKPEPVKLGSSKGNSFRIAIRKVTASQESINDVMASFKEKGFINFYGLERFANSADLEVGTTCEIGKQLLLENWEKAVDLILSPRVGERDAKMRAAKQTWVQTKNAKESLNKLRFSDNTEGKLLMGLIQHGPNDYMKALEYIPIYTRLSYLQSYQSLFWNKVASRRLKKYGFKPIVGDLMWPEDSSQDLEGMMDIDPKNGQGSSGGAESSSLEEKGNVGKPVMLTEETVNSAKMEDIVLPLPGNDVIHPGGEVGSWYKDMLEEAGITSEMWQRQIGKYCLRGSYRHVIKKPKNLTWKVTKYRNPEDVLILSDAEEMRRQKLPDVSDGEMTALVLSFELPASSYASMALREITKLDSSDNFKQKEAQGSSETSCYESNMEQDAPDNEEEDFDAEEEDTALEYDM